MRQNLGGVIGELTTLPGCTQVAVSHSVFVPAAKRGKGMGKAANSNRITQAHSLGYDYMMCTVDSENYAQIKILRDNGWSRLSDFMSSKTGHRVELWGIKLGDQ